MISFLKQGRPVPKPDKLPITILSSLVEDDPEPKLVPIIVPIFCAEATVIIGIFMAAAVMVNGRCLWSAIATILIGGEW